jgi:hypothetical protein
MLFEKSIVRYAICHSTLLMCGLVQLGRGDEAHPRDVPRLRACPETAAKHRRASFGAKAIVPEKGLSNPARHRQGMVSVRLTEAFSFYLQHQWPTMR